MPKVKPREVLSIYKGKIDVKELVYKILTLAARR